MLCIEEEGGTEDQGRGSAQRTPEQWWLVCGVGAEHQNSGLPVGALVGVWEDEGRI